MKDLKKEMMKMIEDTSQPVDDNNGCYVIIYKGRQLILNSGKTRWNKMSHAINALGNQIRYSFEYDSLKNEKDYNKRRKIYKDTLQQLIDEGILEFKKLL